MRENDQDRMQASVAYHKQLWPSFQRTVSRVAFEEEPAILAQFASIQPGEKVLEVGCGTGRILQGLLSITPHVVGVDVLWEAVDQTRRKGAPVIQASSFRLPFKDNAFDCVVCNDVIHSINSELSDTFLRELARVARGRVVLGAVRNRLALFLDLGLLLQSLKRGRLVDAATINVWFYYFWRVVRVTRGAGLTVMRVQPSARYIALFTRYSWVKRLYRIKPGRVGIFGWFFPLPYGVLHYDVLLAKKTRDHGI
ncbi:MAG: class I SAM-dependent methyltransferase [Candidatus Binatia bacterium]